LKLKKEHRNTPETETKNKQYEEKEGKKENGGKGKKGNKGEQEGKKRRKIIKKTR
jgi:hypothetical protein